MADNRKHVLEGKTIIVAGGGIAGCAFAAALCKLWDYTLHPPNITIIERDHQDIAQQREGYSLSITGQDASGGLVTLKKIGLLERILDSAVSGVEGKGSFKIWGADWKEKTSFRRKPVDGLPVSTLRIARKELRQLLQDAATSPASHSIRWETQCISASPTGTGQICVTTKGPLGKHEDMLCDLLVAADGANSKLRAILRPMDKLEYTGAVLRGGLAKFQDKLPKPLDDDWGFQLSGDGVSCFYSPVDKNSIVWALGHMEDEAPKFDSGCEASIEDVLAQARRLGRCLQEPFTTIVNHTDLQTVMLINASDKMPFSHGGDDLGTFPVVFIGDSNHALSPFAGLGANLALTDAWDLAEQMCAKGAKSVPEAVSRYDAISVPRATKIVERARRTLPMGHSTGWRLWLLWAMLILGKLVRFMLKR